MRMFLGQGWNLHRSSDNARSLTLRPSGNSPLIYSTNVPERKGGEEGRLCKRTAGHWKDLSFTLKKIGLGEFPGGLLVKDSALSLLRLQFDPWHQGTSACHRVAKKKRKRKRKKNVLKHILTPVSWLFFLVSCLECVCVCGGGMWNVIKSRHLAMGKGPLFTAALGSSHHPTSQTRVWLIPPPQLFVWVLGTQLFNQRVN